MVRFKTVWNSWVELSIINTSYQKLPFGSEDYPDKLLFHQALNEVSNSSDSCLLQCAVYLSNYVHTKVSFFVRTSDNTSCEFHQWSGTVPVSCYNFGSFW